MTINIQIIPLLDTGRRKNVSLFARAKRTLTHLLLRCVTINKYRLKITPNGPEHKTVQ